MVTDSPGRDSTTSCRATTPGRRRECTGTPATCWPRARWSAKGAATGPSWAAAIISAVRTAVPLGESDFVSRCVSTISAASNIPAALAASVEDTTEPSEKLGMKTAPVPAASTSGRTSAIRSDDHPLVPTRRLMPPSVAARTTSIDTAGVDASATISAPAIIEIWSRDDSSAWISKSGSASTTARMMPPSFPVAPTTATRVAMHPAYGARAARAATA